MGRDESGMGRDESGALGTNRANLGPNPPRAGTNPRRERVVGRKVQASQNVVPVAVTAGDKIEALRQWASGRCLSADRAGV